MTALNFDPYAALAEIQNGGGLRANRAKRANLHPERPDPSQALAQLSPLALSPTENQKSVGSDIVPTDPTAWQAELARLDAATAPQGFTPQRWRQLLEDARWLADRHGGSAAALGWNASDLFGLDDTLDGWGGLADRLRGARRVHLTATIGHWRLAVEDGWLWRTSMRPMTIIWEIEQ